MNFSFHTFTLIFLIAGLNASCQKKLHTVKVSYIQPYCGGARPTPEMVAEGEKLRPFINKTIILISSKGVVDSAKTNTEGIFKKKLAPGTYKLYEAWRYYKTTSSGDALTEFDKECLEKEWKTSFMEIAVTKKSITQKSEGPIVINCSWDAPCLLEKHKVQRRPE